MEVYGAVRTTLAVRNYQEKAVAPDVIGRIVEAGRLTGSAMNSQPWHFIVVQNREVLKQLATLAPSGAYLAEAALAIVVVTDGARAPLIDGTRAISSMQLVAWEEGLGSCWIGGVERDGVKRLLNIPESYELITVLPFGYPTEAAKRLRKRRKALAQIAHHERFGTPFRPV